MSILCCITFLSDNFLNSPWHKFHHLLQFIVAERGPNLTQYWFQLLHSSWVDLLYSSLHLLPHKFNDIEVWRVTWPFQDINLFLFQLLECLVGTMSWCKVVLEHKAIIPKEFLHRWKQVSIQQIDVHFHVHCCLWGQEAQIAHSSRWNASPHHYGGWMLDRALQKRRLMPLMFLPPNMRPLVIAHDKFQLIREDDFFPIFNCLLRVLVCEL